MSNPEKPAPIERGTVVVVDDDAVFTQTAARIFEDLGFRVATLSRAFGLLNALATHRPALLLLDVNMPGIDGRALASLVREDRELRATPIVLCSSIEPGDLAKLATACGADASVTKTLGPAKLRAEFARLAQRFASA